MDTADDELRDTIRMIWPLQADKMVDLLVPRRYKGDRRVLSTGKVYAGLLILESWRTTRFGKTQSHLGVSENWRFTFKSDYNFRTYSIQYFISFFTSITDIEVYELRWRTPR